MVLGKWSWSSDGDSHDHFILLKEDNSCSLQNLNAEIIEAYEGLCQWKILMKSLQLVLIVPMDIAGGFIDANIVSAKLSRQHGLERDEYEQMVLGKWAWSSDGMAHDHFILFKEDHSCLFSNLNEKIIGAYEGQCRWKILMKSL